MADGDMDGWRAGRGDAAETSSQALAAGNTLLTPRQRKTEEIGDGVPRTGRSFFSRALGRAYVRHLRGAHAYVSWSQGRARRAPPCWPTVVAAAMTTAGPAGRLAGWLLPPAGVAGARGWSAPLGCASSSPPSPGCPPPTPDACGSSHPSAAAGTIPSQLALLRYTAPAPPLRRLGRLFVRPFPGRSPATRPPSPFVPFSPFLAPLQSRRAPSAVSRSPSPHRRAAPSRAPDCHWSGPVCHTCSPSDPSSPSLAAPDPAAACSGLTAALAGRAAPLRASRRRSRALPRGRPHRSHCCPPLRPHARRASAYIVLHPCRPHVAQLAAPAHGEVLARQTRSASALRRPLRRRLPPLSAAATPRCCHPALLPLPAAATAAAARPVADTHRSHRRPPSLHSYTASVSPGPSRSPPSPSRAPPSSGCPLAPSL